MASAIVVGLNVLLEVYESFTDLRTLVIMNDTFIFSLVADPGHTVQGHTMKRRETSYCWWVPAIPIMTFSLPFQEIIAMLGWPLFHNIFLLTYVSIRVYSVPNLFSDFSQKKKTQYIIEHPIFYQSPFIPI